MKIFLVIVMQRIDEELRPEEIERFLRRIYYNNVDSEALQYLFDT